jgi:ankyrin repeat protein
MFGRVADVEKLIAEGGDVNVVSDDAASCLLMAALGGHVRVARILISGGARLNQAKNDGATPLIMVSLVAGSLWPSLLLIFILSFNRFIKRQKHNIYFLFIEDREEKL